MLADTNTPVSIYLRLRDKFPCSILLESTDYHGGQNSFSFICCNPIATFKIIDGMLIESYPDGVEVIAEAKSIDIPARLNEFAQKFEMDNTKEFGFVGNGLFGYSTYDAVKYFDDITLSAKVESSRNIPEMSYSVYQYIISINHYKDEMYIFDHQYINNDKAAATSELDKIEYITRTKDFPIYGYSSVGSEESNYTDAEFLEHIEKVQQHIHRGDVFQMVISRRFSQEFMGDEFNVYRALRSINPSPYLFYFDYGSFKIFGSSPEAQMVISKGKASIFPIAGTFKRTGDDDSDLKLAEKLFSDPKENAEHIMLVDLARNDLSRHCSDVVVETLREIQYYSHVIHLVSKVTGKIKPNKLSMNVVADTFPAGTLSGAPKYKAMELIDKYERGNRGYYGGCIGFMGFNGDFNHAIMIRSFLSKDNVLYYQAGAGVVVNSVVENELNEVNNKLMALKSAIKMAEELN
jgi:anthranilate synthase component 1